jgi:hypothetical protein
MIEAMRPKFQSSSSPSFSAMLKYLNSYTLRSLLDAITRSQSLTLCFFKYFFVKYLRYLYPDQNGKSLRWGTKQNSVADRGYNDLGKKLG